VSGRFFIARHGETVFNAAARMQGDAPHTPLTRAGFAQADAIGDALRRELGEEAEQEQHQGGAVLKGVALEPSRRPGPTEPRRNQSQEDDHRLSPPRP